MLHSWLVPFRTKVFCLDNVSPIRGTVIMDKVGRWKKSIRQSVWPNLNYLPVKALIRLPCKTEQKGPALFGTGKHTVILVGGGMAKAKPPKSACGLRQKASWHGFSCHSQIITQICHTYGLKWFKWPRNDWTTAVHSRLYPLHPSTTS